MLPAAIAIWAVVTVILIVLSIHRSIFVMREQDTIFVSETERSTKNEYVTIIERLKAVTVPTWNAWGEGDQRIDHAFHGGAQCGNCDGQSPSIP